MDQEVKPGNSSMSSEGLASIAVASVRAGPFLTAGENNKEGAYNVLKMAGAQSASHPLSLVYVTPALSVPSGLCKEAHHMSVVLTLEADQRCVNFLPPCSRCPAAQDPPCSGCPAASPQPPLQRVPSGPGLHLQPPSPLQSPPLLQRVPGDPGPPLQSPPPLQQVPSGPGPPLQRVPSGLHPLSAERSGNEEIANPL